MRFTRDRWRAIARALASTWWGALGPMLLALAASPAGAANCQLQQMAIPVRIVDWRPVATLKLNGTEVSMLVDSGAFFSMLSPSTAMQLNLPLRPLPGGLRLHGYTGPIDAKRTRVDKVGLLGAELSNVEFVVGGNELGAGIMGVLGRNILSASDTEYDLAHGVVRLTFPKGDCADADFAYWAGQAPVVVVPFDRDVDRSDTEIRLEVKVNGQRMRAVLDTGAPQTALTLRAARRAGIEKRDLTPHGRAGGAGEGLVKSWTAQVASFELGGEKISANRLRIDDLDASDHDMLVGLDYFLSHRIFVSRLQRQVYVTWNGTPVFALGREVAGNYDSRYAAVPQELPKDDADALARRGAAAIASGNHARALEDLNRACELAPEVADNFFARARLHLAMREPRLARDDLDRALKLDPALADARLRRAAVRVALGDRPGAEADLATLDAELPPSSHLRADIGRLFASFGLAPQALRQFDLWMSTHPKDATRASILNERCWLRARLGIDLPLALQDCKQAVDLDGGASAYQDSLGWTHLRMGEARKAKFAFDDAIKLEPRPFSLYGRALAHQRLNDAAAAERDFAAARKLQPRIDAMVRQQGFDLGAGTDKPPAPGS